MSDDIFLTPQLRTGPTSRLLKRRSQIQPPQPQSRHEVTNFAETMDVTSFSQRGTDFQVRDGNFSRSIYLNWID